MVARILDLVKNRRYEGVRSPPREPKSPTRESELLGLIGDLHQQYKSLFALYDHLKQVSGISNHIEDINRFQPPPASPTHSESEYFSSEETEEELINLRNLLASTVQERDILESKLTLSFTKIEEAEALIHDLRFEDNEMKKMMMEASVKMREMKSEAESLQRNNRQLASKLEKKATKAKKLKEENSMLKARGLELELVSKNKMNEMAELMKNLRDSENNGALKVAELTAELNEVKLKVDFLLVKKSELEVEVEGLMNEKMALDKNFKKQVDFLVSKKSELASQVEENKCLAVQVKDLRERLDSKTNEVIILEEKIRSEGESYDTHLTRLKIEIENLLQKLESKRDQSNQLEQESSRRKLELENENFQLKNTVRDLQSLINEHNVKNEDQEIFKKAVELEGLVKEIGEEKREAIRQLCIQVEYQRTRCNDYKGAILKMTQGGRR